METRFDRHSFTVERSVNFLIHWLTDQSTVTGTVRVYYKSHTSIFTYQLINKSIDLSINGRTKRIEGIITRTTDIRMHYLTYLSTDRRIPLSTDTNRGLTGTGRIHFQWDTSIFTYWYINHSIDVSTDRRNGRTDTSVGHHTSGRITSLIYQRIRGYPYQQT